VKNGVHVSFGTNIFQLDYVYIIIYSISFLDSIRVTVLCLVFKVRKFLL